MTTKRTKKPTYHQMFDFLANKYGYQKMLELRDSQDPQAIEKAFQEVQRQEAIEQSLFPVMSSGYLACLQCQKPIPARGYVLCKDCAQEALRRI